MREFRHGITFTQLITFKAIFEAGNISNAAKQLGISSASVSYSLKSLEKQIGQLLFTRTTRAIKPTDVGMQLYESSHQAIDDLTMAVEVICDLNDTPSGKLSLNIAQNIYQVFLKDILQDFQREYPRIQLEITLSDTMDKHTEKPIDVGFRFGGSVNENMIARPITQHLSITKVALFASKDYVDKFGLPLSIAELSGHSVIKFRAPTSEELLPVQLHKTDDPASEILAISTVGTAMVVNNVEVMIDMVSQGFGLGFVMDAMVQDELDSGELIPVLEQHWCDIPTVYMYYAPENRQSLKVRCFLDFINKQLAGNP